MDTKEHAQNTVRAVIPTWLKIALIVVILEKIIQHCVVSIAFFFNWDAIQSSVTVSPSVLLLLGLIAAGCFILSLWGIVRQQKRAIHLLLALAVFDIVGEFIAQGTISIVITVSFLVAILLLILTVMSLRYDLAPAAME